MFCWLQDYNVNYNQQYQNEQQAAYYNNNYQNQNNAAQNNGRGQYGYYDNNGDWVEDEWELPLNGECKYFKDFLCVCFTPFKR